MRTCPSLSTFDVKQTVFGVWLYEKMMQGEICRYFLPRTEAVST